MRPDARNFERSEVSKIRGLGPHPVVRGTVNAQVSACAYACALRRILNVYRGVGDAYSYVRGAFDYTFRYLWVTPRASRISSVRATTIFGFPLTLRAEMLSLDIGRGMVRAHWAGGIREMFSFCSVSFLVDMHIHVHFRN